MGKPARKHDPNELDDLDYAHQIKRRDFYNLNIVHKLIIFVMIGAFCFSVALLVLSYMDVSKGLVDTIMRFFI